MKHLLTLAAMALTTIGATAGNGGANTTDTLVVTTTPQMHCEGCETRIKSSLRFVRGTKKIVTSIPAQTVTIIYDKGKASAEAYVRAFDKIGYKVARKP